MGGFLNLLEAFLAFALTMLALSIAVSSIVEVGYNIFRWRSKGLRDMIVYLFKTQIQGEYLKSLDANGVDQRVDFIMEMTMAPSVKRTPDASSDPVRTRVQQAEQFTGLRYLGKGGRLPQMLWWIPNLLIFVLNRLGYFGIQWLSLKHGLTSLTSEDFQAKLRASKAGERIKEAWPNSWQEKYAALVSQYEWLGVAATEQFRRKSRYFSIIVGFVLAFGVNVDSFDLLNSYLTDPNLRAAVIEKADTYLEQTEAGPDRLSNLGDSTATIAYGKIDTLLAELRAIEDVLEGEMQANLQKAIQTTQTSKEAVESMHQEFEEGYTQIRNIKRSLTENFPIGWTRYPNCVHTSSDARCLALQSKTASSSLANSENNSSSGSTKVAITLSSLTAWVIRPVRWAWDNSVGWVWSHFKAFQQQDPAGFFRWLLGVVTTGILVGLGSPTWVHIVKQLLATRKFMKGGE